MKNIKTLTLFYCLLNATQYAVCSNQNDDHHDNFFGQRKSIAMWKSAAPAKNSQVAATGQVSSHQLLHDINAPANTPRLTDEEDRARRENITVQINDSSQRTLHYNAEHNMHYRPISPKTRAMIVAQKAQNNATSHNNNSQDPK